VEPSYPQSAKAAAAAGAVKVYVALDESGKVSSIFRSEGPVLLKKAAEDAARKWKFPPMLVAGKPVRLTGYIEFNFVP
jgi:TonB family protein